jgi:hypothetical protein
MAVPVINNLSVTMGSYSETPVVNVNFNLQHDDGLVCAIADSGFQFAYESASTVWYDATLHSSTAGTDLESYVSSPGRSTSLRWDVDTDAVNKNENIIFRLNLEDSAEGESGYSSSSAVEIKTTLPTLSYTLESYTNQLVLSFTPVVGNGATYYKVSESDTLSGASWIAIPESGLFELTFSSSDEETKNVYVQVRDTYYNKSAISASSIILHTTAPVDGYLRINGTVADEETYTGISIGSDDAMTPDRSATIDVYADDLYDIQMYIDGDIDDGDNIREWINYKVDDEVVVSQVDIVLAGTDYNYDQDASVTVTFRDVAGNESSVTKTIRLNTKIFQTANRLLRTPSASYDHQVLEVSQSNATTLISETRTVSDSYIRRWNEIFYPTTHDYPRNSEGTIDESACIAMNESSSSNYDAVDLDSGAVNYDSEERPVTVDWTDDGTKDYDNLESSYTGNLRYWIIDNEGYGDIDLEFEHFHLDANSYGPPYNTLAPYTGDHLVIYDATATGATQETIGSTGDREYTLLDSSKLTELYAYTGEGNQVIELSTGYSVSADTNGGFDVPTIRNITRLCLVLYTDASSTSSGFKLKAGPKHDTVFRNYDIDNTNGEVWLHKYPNGQSYSGDIRMIYDYYDTEIDVDLDAGEVVFAVNPSGVVTSDYTHYVNEADRISEDYSRMFAVSNDDFVDYLDPSMYATPSGYLTADAKTGNYDWSQPTPSGLISSNFTVDKDRGVVEFYSGVGDGYDEYYYVPKDSRVTMDYYYHTYKRLSNDGYGILEFRDETIVADDTTLYPDYTFVDVKLVNEGDAILESGKITFLSRGFDDDSDGTIDQVLDVNRPWDVQEGTAAETYDKVAMQIATSYSYNLRPTKSEARSILSNWKSASFPEDFMPRTAMYGRCVWVLGGTSGTDYPTTSVGRKTFSAEISGSYYSVSV